MMPLTNALDRLTWPTADCVRVTYPARRRYTSRRARRQAFYARQRIERTLSAILRGDSMKVHREAFDAAMLACVTTGTGVVEVLWDRGDGEGFTAEPLREGEWPNAMLSSKFVDPWPTN